MTNSTFCKMPFSQIFLGTNGTVKTCCSAETEIGNLNNNTIEEIINGDLAKDVRRTILNNQWHPQCEQCKKLESVGGTSERTGNDNTFEELDCDSFKLERFDLRWSNTCNLACNYCYPYFSSQWANIKGIKINTLKEDHQESLFNYIESNKDTITNINFLGGEPLLLKQNSRLIDILPDKKYYVLTNLSVPVDKNEIAKKLLKKNKVTWGVSFETVGKRFEYVRHNAVWEQFVNNIRYIKRANPSITVNPHPLYCVYSAFNLNEFYDFLINEVDSNDAYWAISGDNSKGLNVFQLSKDLRIKAIDEIERCQIKYSKRIKMDRLISIKNGLLESLEDGKDDRLKFVQWTGHLENTELPNKEFKFKDLWPELYKDLVNE